MTEGNTQLAGFVDRIECLNDDVAELKGDIKIVYEEAKAAGYKPPIIRQLIKERAEDAAKRAERERLLDEYRAELGMLADTPLGEAAMERAGDQAA